MIRPSKWIFQVVLNTDQDIGGCDDAELEIFRGTLLQLCIGAAEVAVLPEHVLHHRLHLGEQVDKLDVRWEQQCSRHWRTQVVLQAKHALLRRHPWWQHNQSIIIEQPFAWMLNLLFLESFVCPSNHWIQPTNKAHFQYIHWRIIWIPLN